MAAMFDELHPEPGWLRFVTSNLKPENFLLYSTLVIWLTVAAAGFGSEVVLGETIVLSTAGDDGNSFRLLVMSQGELAPKSHTKLSDVLATLIPSHPTAPPTPFGL